jgi:hypothetical protein
MSATGTGWLAGSASRLQDKGVPHILVAVTRLHASRSQQNRTRLQHEYRSPNESEDSSKLAA